MKKVLFILMIGLLFTVGACSSNNKADSNPEEKVYKLEETVEVEGIKITVHSFRISKGSEVSKPKDGEEWVVLKVTLENTTDKEFYSSSLSHFNLVDADGNKQNIQLLADMKDTLDKPVPAKDSITGEIAFATKPKSSLRLSFTPFTEESVQIKIR